MSYNHPGINNTIYLRVGSHYLVYIIWYIKPYYLLLINYPI